MNILLKDISEYVGQSVTLQGWIYNFRSSGKIAFLQFRDGTGMIQAVAVKNDIGEDNWQKILDMTQESSVALTGKVKEDERAPSGYEIELESIDVIQVAQEYPISKKEHGPDFLLENRHLWIRSSRQWAILRIRDEIISAIQDYFKENGFVKIDTPIITPNAAEGTTELFEFDYFGEPAYLAQTGQLYSEAAIMSFGRVYDFGPVFRAEKSKTRRHLIEFWMMDAEMAFVEHEGNMKIQEELVQYIVKRILDTRKQELQILERDTKPLEAALKPFIRKNYKDVIDELQKLGSDIKEGDDLGADDETKLTEKYEQPIFVEKYPAAVKAFYMKRDGDSEFVLNNDLLAPEGYGEIIGGSQREDDYETLKKRIEEEGLPLKDFEWYLDLRKYGSVPHSGFGIGLERTVAWICGIKHVRETIPFPRLLNRMRP